MDNNNNNLMDALSVLSFMIGLANYQENLTQSDKDDMMKSLDEATNAMLEKLEIYINEQNEMLREILKRLEDLEK